MTKGNLLKNKKPEIYLISPTKINLVKFEGQLKKIFSLKIIKVFQLRLKKCSDSYLHECINIFSPLCKKYNVLFILNDRPDLVIKYNLQGVHVGEEDASIKECKKILGTNKIIGKSCYNSIDLGLKAQKEGAHYIAFGSFFSTTTKKIVKQINIESFSFYKGNFNIPIVGIGGINKNNISKLKKINLDYVAISSGIWNSESNPVQAMKKIKNLIDKN